MYEIICQIAIDVIQGRGPEFVVNPEGLEHLRQV